MKLCECGCGQATLLIKSSSKRTGLIRGQPRRFLSGHNLHKENHPAWKGGRRRARGYIFIQSPEHPRANSSGYVAEHILVAEKALGRYLPEGAIVHHINEKTDENRNNNLVICPSNAYHRIIHSRMRALEATGNPNARKCCLCKVYETDPETGTVSRWNRSFHHTICKRAYDVKTYKKKVQAELKLAH